MREAAANASEAFCDLIHELTFGQPRPSRTKIRVMCDDFWRCDLILPGTECELLDLPPGTTYGSAAKEIMRHINTYAPPAARV